MALLIRPLRKTFLYPPLIPQHNLISRLLHNNKIEEEITSQTHKTITRDYISEMRKAACKDNLLRRLLNEIQYELDHSAPEQPVAKYESFTVDDQPGEQWVSLKRKFRQNEEIKVEATMLDGSALIPKAGIPGTKDDGKLHITLIVSISKSDGKRKSGVMFRARQSLARTKLASQSKQFCSSTNKPINNNKSISGKTESNLSKYGEAYKQLGNLDFMKAAKILFTDPPKKKKFGIDFHLVQLFFACLPSLAVYLVAQYARREMRKMDAELEKRKKEEEEKAKEEERKAVKEKAQAESELLEVKERLSKVEEALKDVAVESKKQLGGSVTKNHVKEDSSEHKQNASIEARNFKSISGSSKPLEKDNLRQDSLKSVPFPQQDQKGQQDPK